MKNKSGFTLIELLVYMAIMGFIIVVAGRVFSDSTVMRVRSQSMIKVAEEVGKVANIIKEDISQMGARAWGKENAVKNIYEIYDSKNMQNPAVSGTDVYINAGGGDFSSFKLYKEVVESKGNKDIKFDSLVFRKMEFDNGEYKGTREIKWETNAEGELRRYCKTISSIGSNAECPSNDEQGVLIASNVKKFSFFPSAPGTAPSAGAASQTSQDTVFPSPPNSNNAFNLKSLDSKDNREYISAPCETEDCTGVYLETFRPNSGTEKGFNEVYLVERGEAQSKCGFIKIKKGETYVVEFEMPFVASNNGSDDGSDDTKRDFNSTQFLPGKDHIAVGLRTKDGGKIPVVSSDVLLYAPQEVAAASKPRYAEFTAKEDYDLEKACVALTFSFYSPLAYKGKLRFANFKVYRKPTGTYHFVKFVEGENNSYAEGFAKKYAEENASYPEKLAHKKKVKAFELILEIDRNGEVAGSYSKGSSGMAILVPNNGVTEYNGGTQQ